MKRFFAYMFAVSMIISEFPLSGIPYVSAADDELLVQSVSVDAEGNVIVSFSGTVEKTVIKDFSIPEKPPRIVLDITGAKLALTTKTISGISGGVVSKVRSSQHAVEPDSIVRIVCDLQSLVSYAIERSGSEVIVKMGEQKVSNSTKKTTSEKKKTETSQKTSAKESSGQGYNKEMPKEETVSIIDSLSTQPVTLDFNEADLTDVFRILSAKSGVNIIYGDDVVGELTVHLEQVPFKEAFKTILSLKSLVAQQVGENILRIITPEALASQRSKSVTFWRVYPLSYADVNDVKKQIDSIRGAEGRRGIIEIDSRTNSLIVADSPEGLDDINRLIKEIDKKPQQVLIESRFVEVSLDNQLDIGIDWGYYSTQNNNTGTKLTQIGQAEIDTAKGTVTPLPGNTGVQAPIAGQTGSFQFGIVENKTNGTTALIARISALASEGKAKFLSNPKITTLNNQQASIWIGSQIPIRTTTLSDTGSYTSIVYKQVGIELKVTPTINVDNRITLKIRPEVSLPDTTNISQEGDIPINTRYAETTVLIEDNETLVIGGFIEETKTEGVNKVPLLGDIPVLGQFFRSNTNRKSRRELLVFITPKILED